MSEQDKFNSEEEYHFVDDPELISAEDGLHAEEEISAKREEAPSKKPAFDFSQLTKLETITAAIKPVLELIQKNLVLRLTLMVGVILFLILIIYRCTAHHGDIAPHTPTRLEVVQQMQHQRQLTRQFDMETTGLNESISKKKLIDLESSQSNVQVQINALSNQVSAVNSNFSGVTENLKQLSDQVSQLAVALQEQSRITVALTSQLQKHEKKKITPKAKPNLTAMPLVRYFLQAVIPGRAWLIDSNGDTYTVREGSKVANYGMIRYIDAERGRVLTSSGKIISFSQDDN